MSRRNARLQIVDFGQEEKTAVVAVASTTEKQVPPVEEPTVSRFHILPYVYGKTGRVLSGGIRQIK